ncbi:MAG TPA: phosphotransferase [Actinopolymorphaceae bacterium]
MSSPSAVPEENRHRGTRAAGVRASYDSLPTRITRWIERELGSVVVSATDQTGGFSPGPAARLVTASGRRAFVKAVGYELNPDSPAIYRQERAAMEAMPELPWTPRLLSAYDDGEWIGLLFADIEGREPAHPWTADDVDQVFGALADLAAALTPSPWSDAPHFTSSDLFTGCWLTLRESHAADLDPWAVDHLDDLVALQARARQAVAGNTLTHLDIRADNVLITPRNDVVFIDWAWTTHAAPWVDTTLTALDLVISGTTVDVDALLTRHPCTKDTDPDDLTALIATMTGMLTHGSLQPPPPSLPTLRDYQRMAADALLRWTRHRLSN